MEIKKLTFLDDFNRPINVQQRYFIQLFAQVSSAGTGLDMHESGFF